MTGAAVIVSQRLPVPPARAFAAFAEDIALWWQPHPLLPLAGPGALRFEPGPGGRLVATLPERREFEVGRILAWEPPHRLLLQWRLPSFAPHEETEVELLFEPVEGGTRLTVTHRGWDGIPRRHAARHGFPLVAFQGHVAGHWRTLLARLAATLANG
jgi:uncharacterized protein YndB with AHSA1/START domain